MNALDLLSSAALSASVVEESADNDNDNDNSAETGLQYPNPRVTGIKRKASVDVDVDATPAAAAAAQLSLPIDPALVPLPTRLSASLAAILSSPPRTSTALPSSASQSGNAHNERASSTAVAAGVASGSGGTPPRPQPQLQGQEQGQTYTRAYLHQSTRPPSSSPTSIAPTSSASTLSQPPPTPLPEDSGLIRCICAFDDDDGFTIQCERCFAWLHALCVDISLESVPDVYICPLCDITQSRSGRGVTLQDRENASRLQRLRKEAENGLRRARTNSGQDGSLLPSSEHGHGYGHALAAPSSPTTVQAGSSPSAAFQHLAPAGARPQFHRSYTQVPGQGHGHGHGQLPSSPMAQQHAALHSHSAEEESELLAKARGLAYQKSLDSIDPTGTLVLPLPLPPDAHTPIPYANPSRGRVTNPFLPRPDHAQIPQAQWAQQARPGGPAAHHVAQVQQQAGQPSQFQRAYSPPAGVAVPAQAGSVAQLHPFAHPTHEPDAQARFGTGAGAGSGSTHLHTTTTIATSAAAKRGDARRKTSASPAPGTAPFSAAPPASQSTTSPGDQGQGRRGGPRQKSSPGTGDVTSIAPAENAGPVVAPTPVAQIPPPKKRRANQYTAIHAQQAAAAAAAAARAEGGDPALAAAAAEPVSVPAPSAATSRKRKAGALSQSQSGRKEEKDKDKENRQSGSASINAKDEEGRKDMLAAGLATVQAGSVLSGQAGAVAQGSNAGPAATGNAAPSRSTRMRLPIGGPAPASGAPNLSDAAGPASGPQLGDAAPPVTGAGTPSQQKDRFLTDDEDDGAWNDRYEAWQFEYTPVSRLRWASKQLEAECSALVKRYLEEEGEHAFEQQHQSLSAGSQAAEMDKENDLFPRPTSAAGRRPVTGMPLLGSAILSSSQNQRLRTASPVPSSGSSTPAYSSSGVSSALSAPVLPVIIAHPLSPATASFSLDSSASKLTIKPLASSSLSLAPPACTPFSAPTCITSLMNPYPRPTVHGMFTSSAIASGALLSLVHGEILSGEAYRADPVNQWAELGVLKNHTRGVGMPWDLVLDQRRWGDESRFIRQGCHPNVYIRPVIVRRPCAEIGALASTTTSTTASKKGSNKRRRGGQRTANAPVSTLQGASEADAGSYELAFGLYALQDISKREELVLPFDWADDHVLHALHGLLFSPSLVFPSIPSNVHSGDSSDEDDGVPSTSSYTYLNVRQRTELAACARHLYRLSRLASRACLTLLGTTVCACDKRRDCAVGWLWKLGSFTESSSKHKGSLIRLQDFDLTGLKNACATALATDENGTQIAGWEGGMGHAAVAGVTNVLPGGKNNGKNGKKAGGRKRRADLGALVGLPRGWYMADGQEVSAVPAPPAPEKATSPAAPSPLPDDVALNSDIDAEEADKALSAQDEDATEEDMDIDTLSADEAQPQQDVDSAIAVEHSAAAMIPVAPSIATEADLGLEKRAAADAPDSDASIDLSSNIPPILRTFTAPGKAESPALTTPAVTSASDAAAGLESTSAAPDAPKQATTNDSDSDSDLTEPLPSGGEEEEEEIVKPPSKKAGANAARARVESARTTSLEEQDDEEGSEDLPSSEPVKPPSRAKSGRKASRGAVKADPASDENEQADEQDEEEIVRPPKRKSLTNKGKQGPFITREASKGKSRLGSDDEAQSGDEDLSKAEAKVSSKDNAKGRMKGKKGDKDGNKDRPPKSGLPAFRKTSAITKEESMQRLNSYAIAVSSPSPNLAAAPSAAGQSKLTPSPSPLPSAALAAPSDSLLGTLAQEKQTAPIQPLGGPALDILFNPAISPASTTISVTAEAVKVKQGQPAAKHNDSAGELAPGSRSDVLAIEQEPSQASIPLEAPTAPLVRSTPVVPLQDEPAPPPRRVSFKAYKQRTLPKAAGLASAALVDASISEEPAGRASRSPLVDAARPAQPAISEQRSKSGSASPIKDGSVLAEAVFAATITQTPAMEKTEVESRLEAAVPDVIAPDVTANVAEATPVTASEASDTPMLAPTLAPMAAVPVAAPAEDKDHMPPPPPPPPPRARLSFAAYRQRLTTAPQTPQQAPATEASIAKDATTASEVKVADPLARTDTATEAAAPAQDSQPVPRLAVHGTSVVSVVSKIQASSKSAARPMDIDTRAPSTPLSNDEEQEEGEVMVEQDLEPGELASDPEEPKRPPLSNQAASDVQPVQQGALSSAVPLTSQIANEAKERRASIQTGPPVQHKLVGERSRTPPKPRRSSSPGTPPPRMRSPGTPPRTTAHQHAQRVPALQGREGTPPLRPALSPAAAVAPPASRGSLPDRSVETLQGARTPPPRSGPVAAAAALASESPRTGAAGAIKGVPGTALSIKGRPSSTAVPPAAQPNNKGTARPLPFKIRGRTAVTPPLPAAPQSQQMAISPPAPTAALPAHAGSPPATLRGLPPPTGPRVRAASSASSSMHGPTRADASGSATLSAAANEAASSGAAQLGGPSTTGGGGASHGWSLSGRGRGGPGLWRGRGAGGARGPSFHAVSGGSGGNVSAAAEVSTGGSSNGSDTSARFSSRPSASPGTASAPLPLQPPSGPRADRREPPVGPRALLSRGEGSPEQNASAGSASSAALARGGHDDAPPFRENRYGGESGRGRPPWTVRGRGGAASQGDRGSFGSRIEQGIPSGPASMLPRDKGWGPRGRGGGRGRGGYRERD